MDFPGAGTLGNATDAARRIAKTLTKGTRSPTAADYTRQQFGDGSTRTPVLLPHVAGPAAATPNDIDPASTALKIATAWQAGIRNRDIDANNAQVAQNAAATAAATAEYGSTCELATERSALVEQFCS